MRILYSVLLLLISTSSHGDDITLTNTMKLLDTGLFDAFNKCDDAKELDKHAGYFAKDVEFYHDNGGVTWDRESMIANTKKHACGNYTRELVAGTFEAYPIKDFGVITKGTHVFCQTQTKQCEGKAEFLMVWHQIGDKWEVTRVLSYGHSTNG